MNISIDCRFINASGIGRYIQNIVSRIIDDKSFNFVLIMRKEDIDKFEFVKKRNVRIITCNAKMYSLREQIEVPLKIPVCDIFWHPHFNLPLLPVRAKRTVVTIHDMFHMANIKSFSFLQKCYINMIIHHSVRKADKIITVSNFSKKEIIKYTGLLPEKIVVIYPATNLEKFKPLVRKVLSYTHLASKYNIPKKFILYVGNVKPSKNILGLLNAYSLAKKIGLSSKLKLVIVGRKDKFITGISNIGQVLKGFGLSNDVIFTGYVDDIDLPKLYNLAEFFVLPSFYEGFGSPPLEAMACGCPVLVSNAASLPEVCGDAALYCNPYDVTDIAEKILMLATDEKLKEKLRQKGFERVKMFSWERAAEEHIKVFKEVLKKDKK